MPLGKTQRSSVYHAEMQVDHSFSSKTVTQKLITNVATMPISAIMKSMQEIVLYGNVDENDVRWILEQVLTSN